MGGWGRQNDYVSTRKESKSKAKLITGWVDGVQKDLNLDYVIYERSLRVNLVESCEGFQQTTIAMLTKALYDDQRVTCSSLTHS